MTAAASHGDTPVPASTPREITAVLTGSEATLFEREYRRAMAEATESHDLTVVLDLLSRWQRVAWSAQSDPGAHRQMNDVTERLLAGETVATVRWDTTKARLGL